ncbi:hypothetical protein BO78DRAFT_390059 [Aspergillus sclerotiicarbonarius CBS 121057]|uniref:Uncharacterized protein n=1 Tax=Aspergillus sclerotiicarbonarius (strain CBS 121057 / IBT 28362) TaxID=1448318 RepID=A0A319DXZ3_ASPSB|nr:hypothetical protein BO78DRAFT_390059 [Aspergillus sclerotiicarbonarius CBS 121057]
MPWTEFQPALCWIVDRPSVSRQPRGNTVFPSWSWVSIRDKPEFKSNDNLIPIASWAVMDDSTRHGLRWLPHKYTPYRHTDWFAFEELMSKQGCILTKSPGERTNNLFPKVLPNIFSIKRRQNLLASFTSHQIQAIKHDISLICHSQTVTLGVQAPSETGFSLYYQDKEIGEMAFDLLSEDSKAREILQSGSVSMEFLALSASWGCSLPEDRGYKWFYDALKGLDQISPFDPMDFRVGFGSHPFGFSSVNVHMMAITTTDGISRRLGLGYIPLVTWLTLLKPTFKSVVLQ